MSQALIATFCDLFGHPWPLAVWIKVWIQVWVEHAGTSSLSTGSFCSGAAIRDIFGQAGAAVLAARSLALDGQPCRWSNQQLDLSGASSSWSWGSIPGLYFARASSLGSTAWWSSRWRLRLSVGCWSASDPMLRGAATACASCCVGWRANEACASRQQRQGER